MKTNLSQRVFPMILVTLTFTFAAQANVGELAEQKPKRLLHRQARHKAQKQKPKPVTVELISFPKIPQRFIEAQVNNGSKRLFLLDTAASDNALFDWFADELRAQPLAKTPESPVIRATLASLKVGPVQRDAYPVVILKDSGVFKRLNVVGVISPQNFFSDQTITVDFRQNLIVLDSQLKRPLRVQTSMVACGDGNRKTLVEATIGGKKGKFLVNSGTSQSLISSQFATESNMGRGKEPILIGGKTIKEEILKTGSTDGVCESQGLLGMDFLKGLRLTFPAKKNLVVVER